MNFDDAKVFILVFMIICLAWLMVPIYQYGKEIGRTEGYLEYIHTRCWEVK